VADRQPFETVDGGQGDRLAEDRVPRAFPVRSRLSLLNHIDKIARPFVLSQQARTIVLNQWLEKEQTMTAQSIPAPSWARGPIVDDEEIRYDITVGTM